MKSVQDPTMTGLSPKMPARGPLMMRNGPRSVIPGPTTKTSTKIPRRPGPEDRKKIHLKQKRKKKKMSSMEDQI